MRIEKIFIIFSFMLVLNLAGCTKEENDIAELNLSVAASLKDVIPQIEKEYIKDNKNIKFIVNYGSSGSLQKQIEQGAPCDIFISAGKYQMEELNKKGYLQENTYKNLLKNNLVLITNEENSISDLQDIFTTKVKHIGVGDFKSVPVGSYANEFLTNTQMYDRVKEKLVFAKDVKEVLAWTKSGNTEVGFVYYSDAKASSGMKIVENIPEEFHSEIVYPISVIKESKNIKEAKKLEEFLLSDKGQRIFQEFGYKSIEN